MSPTPDEPDLTVSYALARMEAKIDVVLAQHEAKIDQHADDLDDHEERLRSLEARPVVSPRTLWTTLAAVTAAVAALTPFLDRLYS